MSKVFISRSDASVSWGFRLQGGIDYNEPLRVTNVVPNSPADGKIDPGDTLLEIAGNNVVNLRHQDALELIQRCSNALFLTVHKIGYTYPPTSNRPVAAVWKPPQQQPPQQQQYQQQQPQQQQQYQQQQPQQQQLHGNYYPHDFTNVSGGQAHQPQYQQQPNLYNSARPYDQSYNFNNSYQNASGAYNFNPPPSNQYNFGGPLPQQQPMAAVPPPPPAPPAPPMPVQSSYIPMAPPLDAALIASAASTLRSQPTRPPILSPQTSIDQTDLSNVPAALMKSLSRPGGPKPFTYTPGGLDLSKIRESARVRRHREYESNTDNPAQQEQQPPVTMNRRIVPQEPMNHHYTAPGPPTGFQPFSYASTQHSTPPPGPKKQIIHDTDVITQSRSFQMLQGWISDSEKTVQQANKTTSAVARAVQDEQSGGRRRSSGSGNSVAPPSRSFRYLQDQYDNGPDGMTTTTITTEETTIVNASNEPQQGAGLRRGSDSHVPSRSFRYLQDHIDSNQFQAGASVNKSVVNNRDDLMEIYNKPPPSHREREAEAPKFTGSTIPSRSFRFLQMMTQEDENNAKQHPQPTNKPQVNLQKYEVQEHLENKFDGHPSRSFKYLQEMTGESTRNDTSGTNGNVKMRVEITESTPIVQVTESIQKMTVQATASSSSPTPQSQQQTSILADDFATDF
ncbi:unnamed protein product [Didymodactylos carnosus]|uniref:PDZ domain-containing protein n=1 Tax=Didymodactylos carnosus TaxID=1234261 RepID=A0A814JX25_9BILA|nr:unnamed protein product [Didymodactylos carnosus]CAF3813323.1 unnamed protein product [Didymodactylos carnosus]